MSLSMGAAGFWAMSLRWVNVMGEEMEVLSGAEQCEGQQTCARGVDYPIPYILQFPFRLVAEY